MLIHKNAESKDHSSEEICKGSRNIVSKLEDINKDAEQNEAKVSSYICMLHSVVSYKTALCAFILDM